MSESRTGRLGINRWVFAFSVAGMSMGLGALVPEWARWGVGWLGGLGWAVVLRLGSHD